MRMRNRQKYVLNIDPSAKSKGGHYALSFKSLNKMAERAAYYGVWEWDTEKYTDAEAYFQKLEDSFENYLTFKMTSDYVFAFHELTLIDIFPVHEKIRGEIQDLFKKNKAKWEKCSNQAREQIKKDNLRKLKNSGCFPDYDEEEAESKLADDRTNEIMSMPDDEYRRLQEEYTELGYGGYV